MYENQQGQLMFCFGDSLVPSVDCKVENGGCHVFAICSQTAVNRLACSCKPGYHGDGYYCQMIDVCATNNGGCDVNATCLFTAPVCLLVMFLFSKLIYSFHCNYNCM